MTLALKDANRAGRFVAAVESRQLCPVSRTDLGIEAVAGTTDGGGNGAKHNGNPAQCVGVRCR